MTGMRALAQVENGMQPVYRVVRGISQNTLIKVIRSVSEVGARSWSPEDLP